jgi:uncharacterized membrane protein
MFDAMGLRGNIYHRVVVTRDMPPPSAEDIVPGFTQISDAERETIAEWIRSGARP